MALKCGSTGYQRSGSKVTDESVTKGDPGSVLKNVSRDARQRRCHRNEIVQLSRRQSEGGGPIDSVGQGQERHEI